jgi:hypothetical protein
MNKKQLNALFSNLSTSPSMFPEEIDFEERVVHFCRMNRETYARSAFLDDRKTRIDSNNYKVKLDYLLNTFGSCSNSPRAINWIFHTPHSGSTLIARALDELAGGFVLKEPILLIQASSLKRHPQFHQWERSRDWHRFFTMVQELLSRTFSKTDVALIKTTSVCHNLAADIFGGTRPARGLFLYSSLEKYLISLYKGNYLDAYLNAGFQGTLHDIQQLKLMDPEEAKKLPRHQKVALLWLSVVLNLNVFIKENPDKKILALDCQQFFSERETTLLSLTDHFGYSRSQSSIETIVNGPIFGRDAKIENSKWDESAVSNKNTQVRNQFRVEIEDALHWAEKLTTNKGLPFSVPVFSTQ